MQFEQSELGKLMKQTEPKEQMRTNRAWTLKQACMLALITSNRVCSVP